MTDFEQWYATHPLGALAEFWGYRDGKEAAQKTNPVNMINNIDGGEPIVPPEPSPEGDGSEAGGSAPEEEVELELVDLENLEQPASPQSPEAKGQPQAAAEQPEAAQAANPDEAETAEAQAETGTAKQQLKELNESMAALQSRLEFLRRQAYKSGNLSLDMNERLEIVTALNEAKSERWSLRLERAKEIASGFFDFLANIPEKFKAWREECAAEAAREQERCKAERQERREKFRRFLAEAREKAATRVEGWFNAGRTTLNEIVEHHPEQAPDSNFVQLAHEVATERTRLRKVTLIRRTFEQKTADLQEEKANVQKELADLTATGKQESPETEKLNQALAALELEQKQIAENLKQATDLEKQIADKHYDLQVRLEHARQKTDTQADELEQAINEAVKNLISQEPKSPVDPDSVDGQIEQLTDVIVQEEVENNAGGGI
jgi:septal ring factor EnvC (AmiA/AmiB activator)